MVNSMLLGYVCWARNQNLCLSRMHRTRLLTAHFLWSSGGCGHPKYADPCSSSPFFLMVSAQRSFTVSTSIRMIGMSHDNIINGFDLSVKQVPPDIDLSPTDYLWDVSGYNEGYEINFRYFVNK